MRRFCSLKMNYWVISAVSILLIAWASSVTVANAGVCGPFRCIGGASGTETRTPPPSSGPIRCTDIRANSSFCRDQCNRACESIPGDAGARFTCDNRVEGSRIPPTYTFPIACTADPSDRRDDCGAQVVDATPRPTTPSEITRIPTDSSQARQWLCKRVSTDQQRGQCVNVFCSDWGTDVMCCPPGVGTPPGSSAPSSSSDAGSTQSTQSAPTTPAHVGRSGKIPLPLCALSSDPLVAGNCTLDDLINVGVGFANFLMGLAAALFLAIFVYGGFRYIFFAYDSGAASQAKDMLKNSAIGMLIILGATVLIRFVHQTVTGDQCVARKGPSYSCQDTQGMSQSQRSSCVTGLCHGGEVELCCLTSATPPPQTPTEGPGAPGFNQACYDECQNATRDCTSQTGDARTNCERRRGNCGRECTVPPGTGR